MRKIKVIGIGLSGLVGSRIAQLLENKYKFIDFSLNSGVDILNNSLLEEAFNKHQDAKFVLHLAAFTDTAKAHEQRGDKKGLCYRLNVVGTKNIISQCQKYGQRLVHFSTDFVFSGEKEGAYTEDDQPDPIDWYGQTKLEAEKLVSKSRLSAVIARIAFPYRSRFSPKQDLVRKIIQSLKNNSLYPMFTDQIITPTFIDDIAWGVDHFLVSGNEGIFHLVGQESLSPYQLAQKVAKTFGFDPDLIERGSLVEYQKTLPKNSRLWQENLALGNGKISSLGVVMSGVNRGLLKMKSQLSQP
jgi:dTDP-4-dehydrorhamnose reductase